MNAATGLNAAALTVDFRLGGCRSLKEKRSRLGGLKDRFGRAPNVAVCESDHQDAHQRGQWTFVACSSDATTVERTLSGVERDLMLMVDAEVVNITRRWLT